MAPYHHHVSSHRQAKRARRFKRTSVVVMVLVVFGAGAIGIDWFLGRVRDSSSTVVSRENTSSVQAANVSVYRTEYYQFQAPEGWLSITSESEDNTFVYLRKDRSLITQRLTVYVNRPLLNIEADFAGTYVLPVTLNLEDGYTTIEAGELSEHCDTSWPEGLMKNPARISHAGTSIVCTPGSRQYNIVFAEIDGDEQLEFTRQDGSRVSLTIVYSNLTASPNPGDLYDIVSSFEVL